MASDVEEYEFEDIFTREQIADFLETLAEQIRKGFKIAIPMPVRKDGNINITISELLNVEIEIRKTRNRTNLMINIWSEPTEILETKEGEKKEVEEEKEGEG